MTSQDFERKGWIERTILELREDGCQKVADLLAAELEHEHEYIAVETLERLSRTEVVVLYQCMSCDSEITEIEALPKSEWDKE